MSSPLPPPAGSPISAAAPPPAGQSRRRRRVLAGVAVIALVGGGVGVWLATRSDTPSAASCFEGLPLPQHRQAALQGVALFIDFDAVRRSGRLTDEYDTDDPRAQEAIKSLLVDDEFPFFPAAWSELVIKAQDQAPSFGVKDARCVLSDGFQDTDVVRLTVDGAAESTDSRSVREVEDFTVVQLKESDRIELVDQTDAVQLALGLPELADAFGGTIIFEPRGDAAVVHALSDRDGATELTIVWVRPGIDDTELRDDADDALAETSFATYLDVDVTVGDSKVAVVFDVGSDFNDIRRVVSGPGNRLDDPLLGGLWLERN